MAVFAVLSLSPNAELSARVSAVYADENYPFGPATWFVSDDNVTTAQVCAKLGIGNGGFTHAVVVRFESYFGHASTALWEWLKLKGVHP